MLYIQTYKRMYVAPTILSNASGVLAIANKHPSSDTAVWHTTGQRWEENLSVMFLLQIQ